MNILRCINQSLPSALQPVRWAEGLFMRQYRGAVRSGPFQGMRYVDAAFCSALPPKGGHL